MLLTSKCVNVDETQSNANVNLKIIQNFMCNEPKNLLLRNK